MHCPPARSLLPRAAAVLVMAALSSLAYAAVASVAEVVALAVLGLCVPASWVTWRVVRYGRRMRPAPEPVLTGRLVRAPYRLPAGPLAVTDGRGRAVVPGAVEESRMKA